MSMEAAFARDVAEGLWSPPVRPGKVVLVVGPPAAGKSTWVEQNASDGDLIVDYDRIAVALGATGHDDPNHKATSAARGAVLDLVRQGDVEASTVWIVSVNPDAETVFPHDEVVVIDPGMTETLCRAQNAGRPERWTDLIHDWYERRADGV